MPQLLSWCPVRKIVSGGQTGVDRAALDVAIELGIEHGGWCPKGRLAEDGPIDRRYQLCETDSADYAARTKLNVVDSDGTLILFNAPLQRGSLLTYRLAKGHSKPVLKVALDRDVEVADIQEWLVDHRIEVLNVAGPRHSSQPGVGQQASKVLRLVLGPKVQGELF